MKLKDIFKEGVGFLSGKIIVVNLMRSEDIEEGLFNRFKGKISVY